MRTGPIIGVAAVLAFLAAAANCSAGETGVVHRWLVSGPFPDPAPTKHLHAPAVGDPAALAPAAGQAVGNVKWVEFESPSGVVNMRDERVGVKSVRNCTVVGFVYVHSPRTTPAKLLMGFQAGGAAFLNGRQVYFNTRCRLSPEAYRTEVLLGEGWNRLVLVAARYTSGRWQHGFSARLTDPDLKPIAGLKLSTKNPFPDGKARMPKYDPHVSAYAVEHFGTHRIRLTNRTPIDLKNVELLVRSRAGKELMKARFGVLRGHSDVEADVQADEVFFQGNYPGATAVVRFSGGQIEAKIGALKLPGVQGVECRTPHIQRMKPWAAGRCVVLLLTRGASRQPIELVQRGDFEWHWVDTRPAEAEKQLAEELALYKFDCIVVAPQSWSKIRNAELVEKAIAGGAGLVCVNPSGLTAGVAKALGVDPAAKPPGRVRAGKVEPAADSPHPVIDGVPLADLPPVAPNGYALTPGGAAVLAKVGDRPVVAVNEKGKRRAVLLDFGRGAELIWPIGREQLCDPRLPVWERQWSLVLKAAVWAAGKDGRVTASCSVPGAIKRDAVSKTKLSVRLRPAKDAAKATVVAEFRSRGVTGLTQTRPPGAPGGQLSKDALVLQFAIPTSLPAGENEVDVVVKDADGDILNWAGGVFTIAPRGAVDKITPAPEKDVYLPGEEMTFTVSGKAEADGLVLIGRLADNKGRVVSETRRPVAKGKFTQTFKVRTKGLLTPVARFQAELAAPEHTEAQAQHIFFVRQEHVWDTYEPVIWLTRNFPRWYYDIDYFRMLWDVMWVPNGWSGNFSRQSSAYYQMVYGGLKSVGQESLHFFSMNHNWTQATFELRKRNFAKTKDIRWLYRTPIDGKTKLPVDKPDYANLRFGNNPHNSFFPLDDPKYHEWTRRKIANQLKDYRHVNAITYDLMDEGSYTSYARSHDFDFSPVSLKHFRLWLKEQYGTLKALNREWETQFAAWDAVMPMYLRQARDRARGKKLPNYAPWVDHRKYNDIVYNRYIKLCSDAARAVDPDAHVGIGGGQRPNPYGGWDYWLVTNHFTWIENYFDDTNEYIRSFNTPDRRLKACPGGDVWYSVMHGNCGFYRWVDTGHVRGDFSLLPRGATTAKQMQTVLGRGFGKLFLGAAPVDDLIGIHYSQSTIQVSHARGGPGSADQYGNGGPLIPKQGFYYLLEEMGYQYKFVSYAQLEAGELIKKGYKLMILPESTALSDAEAEQLKKFVQSGGVLLCDRWTGEWTAHGRKRPKSVLAEYFGIDPAAPAEKKIGKGWVVYLNSDFPRQYWIDRSAGQVSQHWARMTEALKKARLPAPRARVYAAGQPARRTEIRYFRLGKIDYHAVRAEVSGRYELRAAAPGHVYDMRDGRYAGNVNSIEVPAEASYPATVAISPYRIEGVEAAADRPAVKRGEPVKIAAKVKASQAPGVHALNFRLYGPDGAERRYYGSTLFGDAGRATLTITTALNEAKGTWKVKVADLASGAVAEAAFEVK